jgi:hypothetical protein
MSRVDVFLESSDSKYRERDVVRGEAVVRVEREDAPFAHNGVLLTACGNVQLRVGDSSVSVLESLFMVVEPVRVLDVSLVLARFRFRSRWGAFRRRRRCTRRFTGRTRR